MPTSRSTWMTYHAKLDSRSSSFTLAKSTRFLPLRAANHPTGHAHTGIRTGIMFFFIGRLSGTVFSTRNNGLPMRPIPIRPTEIGRLPITRRVRGRSATDSTHIPRTRQDDVYAGRVGSSGEVEVSETNWVSAMPAGRTVHQKSADRDMAMGGMRKTDTAIMKTYQIAQRVGRALHSPQSTGDEFNERMDVPHPPQDA